MNKNVCHSLDINKFMNNNSLQLSSAQFSTITYNCDYDYYYYYFVCRNERKKKIVYIIEMASYSGYEKKAEFYLPFKKKKKSNHSPSNRFHKVKQRKKNRFTFTVVNAA